MAVAPNAMTSFASNGFTVQNTDLKPFTDNITDLYGNQLDNGFGSIYIVSNATIPAASAFPAMAPVLAAGSGQGLSLVGNLFTLTAGTWFVSFSLRLTETTTAQHLQIMISSDATAGDTGWLAGDSLIGQPTAGSMSADTVVLSATGTTTVGFKADSRSVTAATVIASRIAFMRLAHI